MTTRWSSRFAYHLYAVDAAGTPWIVDQFDNPAYGLARLEAYRRAFPYPHRVHGIWSEEDPERGDVETDLEEAEYERRIEWGLISDGSPDDEYAPDGIERDVRVTETS